jgi:hypothetical protein
MTIPNNQTTGTIYAKNKWNETGVLLEKGETYQISSISITEPLRDAGWKSSSIYGENWQGFWHKLFSKLKRKKNANWFALIGTVDREHSWAFQSDTQFIAPESGMLVCYFNDVPIMYWNNSGKVVLNIQNVIKDKN